jgi:hypothetical protein
MSLPLDERQAMAMSKSMGLSKRGYEAVGGQKLDIHPDTKAFMFGWRFRPRTQGLECSCAVGLWIL